MKGYMKAAVVEGLRKISIKEVPVPKVKYGSVLIKVVACAVCGSDIRIFESGNKRVKYPAIIGHEIAGEIVDVGIGVTKFKVGDKIAIGADVPCGICTWCQNGIGNCCDENYAIGYQFQGGYAEYCLLEPMVMRYGPVCLVPEGVNPEHAALAEPLACCINGLERALFAPGKSLLVIGAGPVGILLVRLARAFGACLTILADINTKRLEMASIAGADYLIDRSHMDLFKTVMDITEGKGANMVFTACPSPSAQEDSLKVVARRGCINFFGGLPQDSRNIEVNSNHIHYNEVYVTGSHGSTPRQHTLAMELIRSKRIDVSDLVTHQFRLEEIHDAFDTVRKQTGLKAMVLPNG